MPKITLVAITITILTLIQLMYFGALVGNARGKYQIKAPAVTGNEMFERYYRVQLNSIEQIILFLPALWIANALAPVAYYWIALIGAVYLIGRMVYQISYVAEPSKRSFGFALTSIPVLALLVIDLIGLVRGWIAPG
ncbi:MAG TPA: MAPEG family protein [Steroidobacteraceae bacterium]|jgi:glutathione S-transferase|nr:MAPEG family protein [Steroidobacteraceae bacterium]